MINQINFMKLFILFFFLIFSPPVATFINVGDKVTSADANQVELQFNNVIGSQNQVVWITVDPTNTGTIQFTVQRAGTTTMPSTLQPFAAGSRIPFTIVNGTFNLFYKASAINNSFSISQ